MLLPHWGYPLFTLVCSSLPWTPTLWCGPLSWGELGLYHKWKPEVDVDSLLQATLPPGPVEDEVDTYETLALAGRVSELSNKATLEHSDLVLS